MKSNKKREDLIEKKPPFDESSSKDEFILWPKVVNF